ncbi:uncharacterized protein LTR77_003369 [Saxophila tyrrhenica]|uniref:Cyclin N-terminal domain-containing protein n=1 Tax=Saxophila tyrrhenica TaxID=1690608 RepID=A0AAV9PG13_9PEZI|nr:hypothetical protein LTR77_003369 [Saxophila tyrrhenica]
MDFQPQQFQSQPQPQFPSYGYCKSYFVENHDDDDGMFARAAADRERKKAIGKLRQNALAEELSQMTADEYQEDVLDHMLFMEGETMPDVASIEIQTEIQWFMRPFLLDFLLEAHHAFQLLPETLHLAVNILDRYCSRRVVYKRHYQLVGCAALLIAAKYGDHKEKVPTIRELKSMCCSLYDDDMFTQMEWHVLQTLNWIVGHPTVPSFIDLAMSDVAFDPEVQHMTFYLSELALYHKEFISVLPSVMARSLLGLARCILSRAQANHGSWAAEIDNNVVLGLSNHLAQPSAPLYRKYAAPHLSSVSQRLELFFHQQRAVAAQINQTPANELQHLDVSKIAAGVTYPQTPQKPGFPMYPAGVLTPPITPDKFHCSTNNALVPMVPNASTPPPSAEQHQYPHTHFASQYMPQPQFVS